MFTAKVGTMFFLKKDRMTHVTKILFKKTTKYIVFKYRTIGTIGILFCKANKIIPSYKIFVHTPCKIITCSLLSFILVSKCDLN